MCLLDGMELWKEKSLEPCMLGKRSEILVDWKFCAKGQQKQEKKGKPNLLESE